jgi:hypothetical protein
MAERKPFLLRIDSELWAELEGWAQSELRSVNGQIEYLLREAVQKRKGVGADATKAAKESPSTSDARARSSTGRNPRSR